MGHHLGEQAGQFRALGGGQRGEQFGLDAGQQLLEPVEVRGAGRGDADHVAAAVRQVGGPPDQPAGGEVVERRHDVAAVHPGAAAELRLAGRPELGQRGEQAVVVAARAGRGQPVGQQPLCVHRGLVDQPAWLGRQPGGRGVVGGHAAESRPSCWLHQ